MSAFDVGQLAQRLAAQYYSHQAAIAVAASPGADALMPATLPGYVVPIGEVTRLDGSAHSFDFRHFLERARADQQTSEEFQKVWLIGSLLTLGDELTAEGYFDRAPILEFVRHLRNGVAHGNRFDIRNPYQLTRYPAHTRDAITRGDSGQTFEITPALNGRPVLFDFAGPADVLDVFLSVGDHLLRLADGAPTAP